MAGCKPEYMPVVIAALEAVTEEAFNLHGVQVTTADSTPLLIINGPIRKQLDINDSFNVFGQGWRANATIGRTIRLIGTNIGGALPGELDRSTLGHAGQIHVLQSLNGRRRVCGTRCTLSVDSNLLTAR